MDLMTFSCPISAKPTPALLRLPTELLTAVSTYCDDSTLLQLRLACTGLMEAAKPPFATIVGAALATRGVIYCPSALRQFLSFQESHVSRSITIINLCACFPHWHKLHDNLQCHIAPQSDTDESQMWDARDRAIDGIHRRFRTEEQGILDQARRLLHEVLDTLAIAGYRVGINIASVEEVLGGDAADSEEASRQDTYGANYQRLCGIASLYRYLLRANYYCLAAWVDRGKDNLSPYNPPQLLSDVLRLELGHALPVDELSFDIQHWHALYIRSLPAILGDWSHLSKLTLRLLDTIEANEASLDTSLGALNLLLRAAPNLCSLTITVPRGLLRRREHDAVLRGCAIALRQVSSSLRQLTLQGIRARIVTYTELFTELSTLESLSLVGCGIRHEATTVPLGEGIALLHWIANRVERQELPNLRLLTAEELLTYYLALDYIVMSTARWVDKLGESTVAIESPNLSSQLYELELRTQRQTPDALSQREFDAEQFT